MENKKQLVAYWKAHTETLKWDKIQKNLARWKEILQNVPEGFDKGKQETIDLRTEPASRLTKLKNSKQTSKQVYTNSLQSGAGQGLVYRGRMENSCHIQTHGGQLCSAAVNSQDTRVEKPFFHDILY